jgi:hypothetical protein
MKTPICRLQLDIYEEIPPELYKAVAKVFVFVEKLKKRL